MTELSHSDFEIGPVDEYDTEVMADDLNDTDADVAHDTDADVAEGYNDDENDEDVEGYTDADFEALGIDPHAPSPGKPGSELKVMWLAARYKYGIEQLWNPDDATDYEEEDLKGRKRTARPGRYLE